MTRNIATAFVQFVQTSGGKRRPIFIIRETNQKLYFFDITTKYANKSETMKHWYFEIMDYQTTGLRKHSWIDTYKIYSLIKNTVTIKYIGKLSDSDTSRLRNFLEQRYTN